MANPKVASIDTTLDPRWVRISDENLCEARIHVGRIRAIADALGQLDQYSEISDQSGFLKHTVFKLMDTISADVDRVEKYLYETLPCGDEPDSPKTGASHGSS